MFHFSDRLFLILLGIALMLTLGDRAVQAQSLQQIETPNQPLPSKPGNETPAKPTKSRQLKRFIGIGGNIGVSGDRTGLSEGGVAMITRNDLNDLLSIRGTTVFGNTRSDNAIALTVNFPIRSGSGKVQLMPFVGGGALISSKSFLNDVVVRGLVTGGIDVPLSRQFSATTSVNVGFTETTSIGVQLGIMYGF